MPSLVAHNLLLILHLQAMGNSSYPAPVPMLPALFLLKLDPNYYSLGCNRDDIIRYYDITNSTNSNLIDLYPNPTTNLINVRVPSSSIGQTITLSDALGNEIEKRKINNSSLSIDLSNYPSGVYYLHTTNGAQSIAQKFVKQ